MITIGARYTLVLASHVKWVLQNELDPQWRLTFLDHLDKMTDDVLTSHILAMVEPMDPAGREILEEARKLGYKTRPNMFTVLDQKFEVFAALNPSLQRACEEIERPLRRTEGELS
jgi:hypothetical protein